MRKIKSFLALTMVAAMAISSTTVFAGTATTGSSVGTGTIETPPEMDVYDVELPTVAANTYSFKMDPAGLLYDTKDATGHEDFTSIADGTMFFKNSAGGYSNTSDKSTITNKSSFDVNVTVTATLTSADAITMSPVSNFVSNEAAHVYFAIKDANGETALAQTGDTIKASVTTAVSGAASQYEVAWDNANSKYTYALKSGASGFAAYDFYLTGACNADANWGDYDQTPQVEVVWSVAKIGEADANTLTGTYSKATGGAFSIALDGFAPTSVTVTSKPGATNLSTALNTTSHYTLKNDTFYLKTAWVSNLANGEWVIELSDGSTVKTLTVTVTN